MRAPLHQLAVAAAALGLSACGPITFTTEVKGEGVVPGSLLGGLLSSFPALGGLTSIDFNENQDFKNHQATRDNVSSLKVESFSLRIVEPADQDFSFLDSVQVLGKTSNDEKLVAEKNGIAQLVLPPPNPTLVFDVTREELVGLLGAPQISIVLRGRGRQPPRDTRLEAKAKLTVALKL